MYKKDEKKQQHTTSTCVCITEKTRIFNAFTVTNMWDIFFSFYLNIFSYRLEISHSIHQ